MKFKVLFVNENTHACWFLLHLYVFSMHINLLYWHNFSLHVDWPHFVMIFLFMSTCMLNCYGLYFPLPSLHWFFFYFKLLISNLSNMRTLIVNEVVSHSTKIVVGGVMVWETWQINKQPSIVKILIMIFVLPNFHHILTWKIQFQLLQRISWNKCSKSQICDKFQ